MPHSTRPNFLWGVNVLMIVGSILLSSCEGRHKGGGKGDGKGDGGGPPFTSFSSTTPDSILAYVKSLRFDTVTGAGDDQRLMLGTFPNSAKYGPRALIHPEENSYEIESKDISIGGKGRVIARLINMDSSTGYLAKLNLGAKDTVFWAVDSVDSESHKGRSMFFSLEKLKKGDPNSFVRRPLVVDTHSDYTWKQSVARWLWDDNDEKPWGSCGGPSCCR